MMRRIAAVFAATILCILTSSTRGAMTFPDSYILVPEGEVIENAANIFIPGLLGPLTSVAFSPDGKLLTTASEDNEIHLWDLMTGNLIRIFETRFGGVNAVTFSPDGERLAIAYDDNAVRLWDISSGRMVRSFDGHSARVEAVAFSHDGTLLATGSADRTARLWDASSGSLVHPFQGHSDSVYSVGFSLDGKLLATASGDKTARLWDLGSKDLVGKFEGHLDRVNSVAFSPDSRLLATASYDNRARIWDVDSGKLVHSLEGSSGIVYSVAFSPDDGRLLATTAADKTPRLWDVSSGKLVRVLDGHSDWVRSAAFSPSGKLLATASRDQSARLWDIFSGNLVRTFGTFANPSSEHTCYVNSIALSHNGKLLATGSSDSNARLWDTSTGALVRAFEGHSDHVTSVNLDASSRSLLATASRDKTARIWDVTSGILVRSLKAHSEPINSIAFNPAGTSLLTSSDDDTACLWNVASGSDRKEHCFKGQASGPIDFSPEGDLVVTTSYSGPHIDEDGRLLNQTPLNNTVRLWNAHTGALVRSFDEHTASVNSVAFSPVGKLIATASDDQTARIWDVTSDESVLSLEKHATPVHSIEFSPDGAFLGAASYFESTLPIWQAATGKIVRSLPVSYPVSSFAFAPDGQTLAAASHDGRAVLWDFASGTLLHKLEGTMITFSADGTFLASSDDCTARLWDVKSGTLSGFWIGWHPPLQSVPIARHSDSVRSVAFSRDGELLATASFDATARLWDVSSGTLVQSFEGHSGAMTSVAFSPDGRLLATASGDDTTARLWDVSSGTPVGSFAGHSGFVTSVAFSPDGKLLATASVDNTVRLWELASFTLVGSLEGHSYSVTSIDFSPDGKLLATASVDHTARLWDVSSGTLVRRFESHLGTVTSVDFSPDGKLLATASDDGTASVWDVSSGTLLRSLEGHSRWVSSVAFSLDGKLLATASDDNTTRLWDVSSGTLVRSLEGHSNSVTSVAFSPDGKLLATASDDNTARLWRHGVNLTEPFAFERYRFATLERGGRLIRRDDGTLLSLRGEDGIITPLLPPHEAKAPHLGLQIISQSEPGEGPETGRIVVRVENASDGGRAYWIRVEAEGEVPHELSILPSVVRLRLEPGASVALPVTVSTITRSGRPGPRRSAVTLVARHAHDADLSAGDRPRINVDIANRFPALRIKRAEHNGRSVLVTIENYGAQAISPLRLSAEVSAGSNWVPVSEPQEIPNGIAAGAIREVSFQIPDSLKYRSPSEVKVVAASSWPTHRWEMTANIGWPWITFAAIAILLVLATIGALHYNTVYRDPLVLKVAQEPTGGLRSFRLRELGRVQLALTRAGKFNSALMAAGIPRERWGRLVSIAGQPEDAVKALADATGSHPVEPIDLGEAEVSAWTFKLPSLRLRYPPTNTKLALVVVDRARIESGAAARTADALRRLDHGVAMVLDRTENQRARDAFAETSGVDFVVLDESAITNLILSDRPLRELEGLIALQRPPIEISPYQTSGGLDDRNLFFGRKSELRRVVDTSFRNILVVGPRQMGKSSLLKEIRRRFENRHDLEVHYKQLSDGDLGKHVAEALGRPAPSNPEEFRHLAAGSRERPHLFLLDEVDEYVRVDAAAGYGIARAMRALKEEGLAYFILAGYWHLYAAALQPDHPLRNFGEIIRLGPLEETDATQLVVEPMETLRLRFANPASVEWLLKETGCRANLLSVACTAVIEGVDPKTREISHKLVVNVVQNSTQLREPFRLWLNGPPLDRAITRAALIIERPRRDAIRALLERLGYRPSPEELNVSLDRLELTYVLLPVDGVLHCPVPLLKRAIIADQYLEEGIRDDLVAHIETLRV